MIVYFGEVGKETLEWGGEFFVHEGKYYEFSIEFNGEDVVISDSIGRYVPFDPQSISGMLKGLRLIGPYCTAIAMGQEAIDTLESDKVICV